MKKKNECLGREKCLALANAVLNDMDCHPAFVKAMAKPEMVLPECFMTSESGGGSYRIVMRFQNLLDLQSAHRKMIQLLSAEDSDAK